MRAGPKGVGAGGPGGAGRVVDQRLTVRPRINLGVSRRRVGALVVSGGHEGTPDRDGGFAVANLHRSPPLFG